MTEGEHMLVLDVGQEAQTFPGKVCLRVALFDDAETALAERDQYLKTGQEPEELMFPQKELPEQFVARTCKAVVLLKTHLALATTPRS